MLKIAKNDEESIRNSDTLENIDEIKMPKIAKKVRKVSEILISLKTFV